MKFFSSWYSQTAFGLPLVLLVFGCGGADNSTVSMRDGGSDGSTDSEVPADSGDPNATGPIGGPLVGEAADDRFGTAVAISADGSRVVIGAKLNDGGGDAGAERGHARVFERDGDGWVQLGQDLDGEADGDRSGSAVAISNDGLRVAIGAPLNDGNGNQSGQVRVFDLDGDTWTQVGEDIDGGRVGDQFGASLALSADGDRIIVGAPLANEVTGRAYVLDLVGGSWTQVGDFITSDHETGFAVAISDDGGRIAVSAPFPQSSDAYPGRVTVYDEDNGDWVTVGSALVGVENSEGFGASLAFSADGETLAIGATTADGGGNNSGTVRVYSLADSPFVQIGDDMDGPVGVQLGTSVSLSADGTRLIAGGSASANSTARLYVLSGDSWDEQTNPEFPVGRETGTSVAISPDGHTIAVASTLAGPASSSNRGEVQLYQLK
ncbi:MAG: hypothetical protein R3A78_12360 [Polyangiales bacterium]|nr:hypothetical protein [Myxococcales bacterium]